MPVAASTEPSRFVGSASWPNWFASSRVDATLDGIPFAHCTHDQRCDDRNAKRTQDRTAKSSESGPGLRISFDLQADK